MPDKLGEVVFASPDGQRRIGVLLKRTYTFQDGGGCDVADEDQQEPICFEEVTYEELDPPRVSPVQVDNDLFAFRRKTDLVVQGSAYAYVNDVSMTHVSARIGTFERTIRVYGERRLIRGINGELVFDLPEPFDSIPIRYDRAYGGVDVTAFKRRPAPLMLRELAQVMPQFPIATDTPFHYARNPCGRGFLIEDDEESLAAVEVPNLEFPFDPITPERLAVRSVHGWVDAPLPACMDWQSAGWFPRIAYLGGALFPPDYKGPVRETELGWAAAELVDIQPVTCHPEEPLRMEFTQGASAGMSLDYVAPGELVQLRNLHPVYPFCTFRLPDEVPRAVIELGAGNWNGLEPHLNAIVIRPEEDQVVMIWCASAPVASTFRPDDIDELRREVSWLNEGSDPNGASYSGTAEFQLAATPDHLVRVFQDHHGEQQNPDLVQGVVTVDRRDGAGRRLLHDPLHSVEPESPVLGFPEQETRQHRSPDADRCRGRAEYSPGRNQLLGLPGRDDRLGDRCRPRGVDGGRD